MVCLDLLKSLLFFVDSTIFGKSTFGRICFFVVVFFAFSKHLFQANQSHVINVDPQLPSATVCLSWGRVG